MTLLALLLAALAATAPLGAWGAQGHRLVALVAEGDLSASARRNVRRLLGDETMADVASWADEYLVGNNQTSYWHYVNIPPDAKSYDRDRDCPRQPGVNVGARGDIWRDCVVDRIRYNEERLADAKLDRSDRAIALKFLVHFVGDIHQPFHASAIERGGNGIVLRSFGLVNCGGTPERPTPCNLHGLWDTGLIAHVDLTDRRYLDRLETVIATKRLRSRPIASAADWAMESLTLSNAVMLPQRAEADEAYFRAHIATVDERLALGGVRLATLINRSLAVPIR